MALVNLGVRIRIAVCRGNRQARMSDRCGANVQSSARVQGAAQY